VLQVGLIVIPRVWLKGFEVTTYMTKRAPFFSGAPLIRTPQLGMFVVEKSYDG